MSSQLDMLRSLLVGKTISGVEKNANEEGLFHLALTDGSGVDVYATDLGWWVREQQGGAAVFTRVFDFLLELSAVPDIDEDTAKVSLTWVAPELMECVLTANLLTEDQKALIREGFLSYERDEEGNSDFTRRMAELPPGALFMTIMRCRVPNFSDDPLVRKLRLAHNPSYADLMDILEYGFRGGP